MTAVQKGIPSLSLKVQLGSGFKFFLFGERTFVMEFS
jgi:hypothetical protein